MQVAQHEQALKFNKNFNRDLFPEAVKESRQQACGNQATPSI